MSRELSKGCLLTDFGSTFTKVSLVSLDEAAILGQSSAFTTVATNVMEGWQTAMGELAERVDLSRVQIVSRLACSSAGGGLKIVASGLAPDFTVEAASRAALGAGARILKSYSYFLRAGDLREIAGLQPDIILLCGGENGGNKKCIIENARALGSLELAVPIIVAGNETAYGAIAEILKPSGHDYYFTENVMPAVNHLNVGPVRSLIRQIFMERIVQAKGMADAENRFSQVIMPTPTAVLLAAELLAKGTGGEAGLGDLMVVDIGGATTDIHTISQPIQDRSLVYDSLEEPESKRTVEGDLGMRYSALSLYESLGEAAFTKDWAGRSDSRELCRYRSLNPEFVAKTATDIAFDQVIARLCVETAVRRHCGHVTRSYRSGHQVLVQSGKDLRHIRYVIGTGGVIVNSQDPGGILRGAGLNQPGLLSPVHPELVVDQQYLFSAMGLLSSQYPDTALRILKKNLLQV